MAGADVVVVKAMLVGDSNVGKTSLTDSICRNRPNKGVSTTGVDVINFRYTTFSNGPKEYHLYLSDVSGLQRHRDFISSNYAWYNQMILVFDICSLDSFESLEKNWVPDVQKLNSTCKFVLVGNKTDLMRYRTVSKEQALEFAQKLDCAYVEVNSHFIDPLIDQMTIFNKD